MNRRQLKEISLTLGTPGTEFRAQVSSWNVNNDTDAGNVIFTFAPGDAGQSREDTEPSYSLRIAGPHDWTEGGLSDYLWDHDGEELAFVLIHHNDSTTGWKVQWAGNLKIMAPSAGGDAKATDMYELTLPISGKPAYSRPA